jgi:DEAD/DEAH box helicase domain-containing protein
LPAEALAKAGPEDGEGQWHWTSESYPANAVSLRSVSSDNFVITDHTSGAKVIGETDFGSALSTLHPKAIYMVEGRIYQVEELDFIGRKAHVREVDCDYYTTAITHTKVTILDRFAADAANVAQHGEVHVVSRVVGFKKIKFQTNENVGSGELDLPEQQMHTTAYWLEIPLSIISALPYATDDRRDGIIGLAFAMKQVALLLLMCDGRDIGLSVNNGDHDQPPGWSRRSGDLSAEALRAKVEAAEADTPRIFIYDAYPGGIGFSAPLWGMQTELLSKTSALISSCECDTGCPMCVGPIGETGPLAKKVALRMLEHLLAGTQAVAVREEEVPF